MHYTGKAPHRNTQSNDYLGVISSRGATIRAVGHTRFLKGTITIVQPMPKDNPRHHTYYYKVTLERLFQPEQVGNTMEFSYRITSAVHSSTP